LPLRQIAHGIRFEAPLDLDGAENSSKGFFSNKKWKLVYDKKRMH